ncbi:MAG: M28 family peptidase [Bacteroidota bacterium]|nr:M28 family peptidase [Bacteroidota bacterium]
MYKTLIILLLSVFCFSSAKSQNDQEIKKALDNINSKDLIETVKILSSPKYDGRFPGAKGYDEASEFMRNEFKKSGLRSLNNDNYYQKLNVEYNQIDKPYQFIISKNGVKLKSYKLGNDFVFRCFTGGNHIKAQVVFCGYGISVPESGYDDYSGIDVKNKIVMVFKHNPKWKINGKVEWPDATERTKVNAAVKHGAIGIIYVSEPNESKVELPIGSAMHGEGNQNTTFPQLHAGQNVAVDLLQESGYNLSKLQSLIDSLKKPLSLALKTTVEIEVHTKYVKDKATQNVYGIIEGSDPELKNEYLIVSAHLDHVGSQAGEIYFPGANDNASGSSSVLQMARTYSKMNVKPKRSILFIVFASEEQGLTGSTYSSEHPLIPLEKVSAMINLDCIAFGDSIQMGNGKSVPELWKIAREKDSLYTKQMTHITWKGGGADGTPFHKKGVPMIYSVTKNSYGHLHCLSDKVETLNPELFEKVVRLAYLISTEVTNGNYKREKVSE